MTHSVAHEALVAWLRDEPAIINELLHLLRDEAPRGHWKVDDSALRKAYPVEARPDLVLRDARKRRWLLIEVQRHRDEAKARRWLVMVALMTNRHGPDGDFLVITHDAEVARWAQEVAVHEGRFGARWGVSPTVLLLGVTEADTVLTKGAPELAVVAAWAVQGRDDDEAEGVVLRALDRTEAVADEALRRVMVEGILSMAGERLAARVREAMIDLNKLPKNPVLEAWKEELRGEGHLAGQREGLLAGQREGRLAGQLAGAQEILLLQLRERGFAVTDAHVATVRAAADQAQIHRWAARVLSARSVDEVFADG